MPEALLQSASPDPDLNKPIIRPYSSQPSTAQSRPDISTVARSVRLSERVNTLGPYLQQRLSRRVHKIAIDAGMDCPNRDGSKGQGGCTFCNNASFSPNDHRQPDVLEQMDAGRSVILKRTGAKAYLAYFQAYTNTYADVATLKALYNQALERPDVVGLSVGTRPDCVPDEVLALLADYQHLGYEVWLELGLQSAFDHTLDKVNRGHDFNDYQDAINRAHQHGLKVCTHLMLGLPGEDRSHYVTTLNRVLQHGVEGLKLHPLHVVKGTQLARDWNRGDYDPMTLENYIECAVELIELTPADVVYHRLTGSAPKELLLAPLWCGTKWQVLNGIRDALVAKKSTQGKHCQITATDKLIFPSLKRDNSQ